MALTNKKILITSTLLTIFAAIIITECYLHYILNIKDTEIASLDINQLTRKSTNPQKKWEYLPNQKIDFNGVIYQTDQYGFRNNINFPHQRSTKKRIAFIGDSITLGFQTTQEKTFVNIFQQAHPDYEVINFGVDGYDTSQIHALIENDVLKFEPDEIIYTFCLNDFDNKFSSGMKGIIYGDHHFYLPVYLEGIIGNEVFEYHQFIFLRNKQKTFSEILAMKEISKKNGIKFQILISPVFFHEDANFSEYKLNKIHDSIKNFLAEQEIEYIDLLDYFKDSLKKPAFYSHDIWHPNNRGHKLIGKVLNRNKVKVSPPHLSQEDR